MAATFDTCFKFTIGHEGGWGNDPRDRGNWTSGKIGVGELKGTKYGISAMSYPQLDIKNLTLDQAKAIYKRDYWDKVAGTSMPAGVDLCVWDMGVNAGVSRSLSLLASSLGTTSRAAANLASLARRAPDQVALIKKFSAKRLSFYQALSTFKIYGKGWTRRTAECEAQAVKMALSAAQAPVKEELIKEQKAATKAATKDAAKAGGSAAVPTSTQIPGSPTHIDISSIDWPSLAIFGVVIALVVGFFVFRWYVNRQRALAYEGVANAVA